MSIARAIFGQKTQNRSNLVTFNGLEGFLTPSSSGVNVTVDKALAVATVFSCLQVKAEGVAQVPLKIHKSLADGKHEVASDHNVHKLISIKPNHWQTPFEFVENLMFQAGLVGNFYAFKNKSRGKILSLLPFEPGTVITEVDQKRNLQYKVTIDGEQRTIPADMMWHVKGPSWRTYIGMEAVKYAREAIGLAINIEESQNKLHASGVQTSGIYSVDGALNQKQATDLMQWIETRIGGSNRHKPLVVDRGAKFTPISMSGADAQTIENRRFQIEEICRAFRVMPIMIGQADKAATYASAEQMFLAHVIHTLMPWYTRIEQSINMNLLTDQDISSGYYAKFNANALMRGAAKDRAEFYDKMYRMKAFSPNQILALEDMNPYDGGDEYYIEPGSQLLNDNKTSE